MVEMRAVHVGGHVAAGLALRVFAEALIKRLQCLVVHGAGARRRGEWWRNGRCVAVEGALVGDVSEVGGGRDAGGRGNRDCVSECVGCRMS